MLRCFWTFFPLSTAICPQGCRNGGICVAPGICSCPDGWLGGACHTGEFVARTSAHLSELSYSGTGLPSGLECFKSEVRVCGKEVFELIVSPDVSDCRRDADFFRFHRCLNAVCCVSALAVCSQPCLNGGKCISPNKCRCRPPFSGPRCQERKKSH